MNIAAFLTKKSGVCSLLCLFLVTGVLHTASAQKFRLGLRAAPTVAWMKSNTSNLKSDGTRLGFSYGIITDYFFAENYALSGGVDVVYKGGGLSSSPPLVPAETKTTYDLQFVEVPLMLKMQTNQVGHFKYFGQFGLAAAARLKYNHPVNAATLALVIGGGVEMPFNGKTAFVGGINFNNGFTDIVSGSSNAVSNYLALNLGILF